MKRFLLLFSLAIACAGIVAALRPGADIPYWIAVIALAIAVPAAGIAMAAYAKLVQIKKNHALLAAKFEEAVYRLEKRNDLAQTRVTMLSQGGAQFATPSATALPKRGASAQVERTAPIVLAPTPPAKSHSPLKAERTKTRFALPERLARQHKSAEKGPKRQVDTGPFSLTLQPVLELPNAVPTAYIAFGKIAGQHFAADERLPETLDRAEFCDQLIAHAMRICEQLEDKNSSPTPVICGLTAEFLADPAKVKHLVSVMIARPNLANWLIFSIPARMTGTVALQRDALDKIVATGVKFAVSGDLASLAIRKARAKLPLAYILAAASEFSNDAAVDVLRSLVSRAKTEHVSFIGLNAETEEVQTVLMDAGVRYVTSAKAAPPRALKSDLDASANEREQSAAN